VTTVSDPHLIVVRPVTPRTPRGREECLRRGTRWVHSRLRLTCGHVCGTPGALGTRSGTRS